MSATTGGSRRRSAGLQNGEFGQAIDINLKYETYSNVTFTDTMITNSGHSDRTAPVVRPTSARPSASRSATTRPPTTRNPADFDGQIVFNGLSIDGTSTGVRVGEPGKDNVGPDVLLQNVTIGNATVTDLANVTDPVNGDTTSVELAATETGLNASTSQADVDVIGNALANTIITGSGDDTITGGLGADNLTGGDGNDTFKYVAGDGADTIVGGARQRHPRLHRHRRRGDRRSRRQHSDRHRDRVAHRHRERHRRQRRRHPHRQCRRQHPDRRRRQRRRSTGGAGLDTAAFATTLTVADVVAAGVRWTVTTGSGPGTEIDTLFGIEFIEHGGGRFVLIDPSTHQRRFLFSAGGSRRRCRYAARRRVRVRRGADRGQHHHRYE